MTLLALFFGTDVKSLLCYLTEMKLQDSKCHDMTAASNVDAYGTVNTNYSDVIMGTIASQVNSLTINYPIVYSGADQWKHQSSASLTFVRGIHRWPVNSPHKVPVTRKMFPFGDVIMSRKDHELEMWKTDGRGWSREYIIFARQLKCRESASLERPFPIWWYNCEWLPKS